MMRHLYFIIYIIVLSALYFMPVKALAGLSFNSNLYSHFLLIPVVSIYFFVMERKAIFTKTGYSFGSGIPFVAAGLLFFWLAKSSSVGLNQNDYLALMMFSLFLCINGGFIGIHGGRAFRKALFPLLFLIFMVPIPTAVLDGLIKILLPGSAETAYAIFKVLGVPVYRDGFVFELPGLAVEVARLTGFGYLDSICGLTSRSAPARTGAKIRVADAGVESGHGVVDASPAVAAVVPGDGR